jgi:hypothetical protein
VHLARERRLVRAEQVEHAAHGVQHQVVDRPPVISSVVAALAAIGAALISAHFQRKTAREHAEAMRHSAELEKLKSELRDEVRSRGLDRPEWTRLECERRLNELGR